jgi:hypothetical protein
MRTGRPTLQAEAIFGHLEDDLVQYDHIREIAETGETFQRKLDAHLRGRTAEVAQTIGLIDGLSVACPGAGVTLRELATLEREQLEDDEVLVTAAIEGFCHIESIAREGMKAAQVTLNELGYGHLVAHVVKAMDGAMEDIKRRRHTRTAAPVLVEATA